MKKRYHKKSRNGCKSCRERRVKCDEVHPACGNCVRRNDYCTWYSNSESSSSPPEPPQESADIPQNPSPHPLDMMSLELLHNYATNTVYSIASRKAFIRIMQELVPRQALSCPTLMHAMLAFSALHLCVLTSGSSETSPDTYSTAAVLHFRSAREQLPLEYPMGKGESIALARCLLSMYTFVSFPMQGDRWVINAVVQMHTFLAGVFAYKDTNQYLGPLYFVKQPGPTVPMSPSLEQLSPLSFHVFPDHLFSLCPPSSVDFLYYRQAVQLLKDSWIRACVTREAQIAAVFRWIEMVPEGYVALLKAAKPEALIVLAHHHAMALLLEHQNWWIHSRGGDAMRSVLSLIEGDEWEFWLEWPRGVLRELEKRNGL